MTSIADSHRITLIHAFTVASESRWGQDMLLLNKALLGRVIFG